MTLRWPKSNTACDPYRTLSCKEQKEKLTVFMVREMIPRCCFTADPASQQVFHVVLNLFPPSQLCILHLTAPETPTKPYSTSLPTPGVVHSAPLMSLPPSHTALQSALSKPLNNPTTHLSHLLNIYIFISHHPQHVSPSIHAQISAKLCTLSPQVLPPSLPTCQSIARATARCQDLGTCLFLALFWSP